MATIADLKTRINEMASRVGKFSIGKSDLFNLLKDMVSRQQSTELNMSNLSIRKIYASVAAMTADVAAPIGSDGEAILKGQLVSISNDSDPTEMGQVYRYGGTAWEYAGKIGDLSQKADKSTTDILSESLSRLDSGENSIVYNNSTMNYPADWQAGVGTPVFDIDSTTTGKMHIEFTASANEQVKLSDSLIVGRKYLIKLKAKLVSGSSMPIRIGLFTSTYNNHNFFDIRPTATELEYTGIVIAGHVDFSIGALVATNTGAIIEIDDVTAYMISVKDDDQDDLIQKLDSGIISGNDSSMNWPSVWEAGIGTPTFDIDSTSPGKMYIDFNGSNNQQIKLTGKLTIGQYYLIRLKAKLISGNSMPIRIGAFSTQIFDSNAFDIIPTGTETEFTGVIKAQIVDLSIGALVTTNLGSIFEIDDIYAIPFNYVNENHENRLNAIEFGILTDGNSSMNIPNNWQAGIGTPVFDIDSTTTGKMHIEFTASANEQIKLIDSLIAGREYFISLKAKLISGNSMPVRIGAFSTQLNDSNAFDIIPTGTETEFTGIIKASGVDFSLGALITTNTGAVIEIDDIFVIPLNYVNENHENRLKAVESYVSALPTQMIFNTDSFIRSLSKYDKPLTKFCVVGDSLMGNSLGGDIPLADDEGNTKRPIRLTYNTISRRIYDLIKFNPAIHRRLDNADWNKSGTWNLISTNNILEPSYSNEFYHSSSESGAYVEIVIPDGYENFALVCRQWEGFGILNFTLNGGSVASYGPSVIDLNRINNSVGDLGNPFYTIEFNGLPSGTNTIRVTKSSDIKEVQIWGGFYWTGNTLVVHNVAHGGHAMNNLIADHLTAEVIENDFDAILFEITIMNEASHGRDLDSSLSDLKTILDYYINGKDICLMTVNPFGTDPTDGIPNYYANYTNPTMEDYINKYRPELSKRGLPFIDVFHFFKLKIENRGGSLETGEGGLWYTLDGQHPNTDGVREWWNIIRFIFSDKPIMF